MENSSAASGANTVIEENGCDPPDVPSTKISTENIIEGADAGKEVKKDEEGNKCLDEMKDELEEGKGLEVLKDGVGMKEVEEVDVQNKTSEEKSANGDEKDPKNTEEGEENKDFEELKDLKGTEDGEEREEVGQSKEPKEKEEIGETMYSAGQKAEGEAKYGQRKQDVEGIKEVDGEKHVIKTVHLEGQTDAKDSKVEESEDGKEEKGREETKDEEGRVVVEEMKHGDEEDAVEGAVNVTKNRIAEATEDNVKDDVKIGDSVIEVTGEKEVVEEGKSHKVDSSMELLKDSEDKQGAQRITSDEQKRDLGSENNVENISKLVKDKGVKAKKKPKVTSKVELENVKKNVAVGEKDTENVSSGGLEEEKDDDVEDEDIFEQDDLEKRSGRKKVAASFKKRSTRGEKVKDKGEVKGKLQAKEKEESEDKPKELLSTPDTSSSPALTSRERPVRERKIVERLVEVIEKEPNKAVIIEKGRGTPLKDIPNVAYKMARKKPAELKFLHQTLFGRRGKLVDFKSHILQFSGFAWHETEEKQRARLKEKLDKFVKDDLLDFCDLLDLTVSKTSTKKEEIIVKLLDFLEAPHATTDVILAEKEQSEKPRKRKRSGGGSASRSSGGTFAKKSSSLKRRAKAEGRQQPKGKSPLDTKDEDEEEETENGVPDEEDDAPRHSESDEKENESSEASDGDDKNEDDGEDYGKGKQDMVQSPEKQTPPIRDRRRMGSNPKKVSSQTEAKSLVKEAPSSNKQSKVKKDDAREKVFMRRLKKETESPEASDDDGGSEDVSHLGKRNEDIKQSPQQHGSSISKKRKRMGSNSKMASSQSVVKSPAKIPSSSKPSKIEKDDTGEKVFTRKKKDADSPKKSSSNSKPVVKDNSSGRKAGKRKATSEEQRKSGPSKADLRKTICETLKEVDFNTATFTDILKKLAAHYKMDLTPKKASIKQMIQEELTKLADEAEDSEEEETEDAGKEETPKPAAKKVKS